ncbi:MAG: Uma2 family endonuclease [Luteolibacter sp.]
MPLVDSQVLQQESELRERFREEIDLGQSGEFINGEIVRHLPFRHLHNQVSSLIAEAFGVYASVLENGSLVRVGALCGFSRNDYEPDIAWFGPKKAASLTPETTIYPIPDFIIEILSPATEKRDRGVKLEDYAAHGVAEYWIVDADKRTIEQYLIAGDAGVYHLAEKLGHGDITPFSFPGLAIPLAALFEDAANLVFLRSLL